MSTLTANNDVYWRFVMSQYAISRKWVLHARKPVLGFPTRCNTDQYAQPQTIHVAETKVLISCAVTVQLICVFVFACAKIMFSPDAAHFMRQMFKLKDVSIPITCQSKIKQHRMQVSGCRDNLKAQCLWQVWDHCI